MNAFPLIAMLLVAPIQEPYVVSSGYSAILESNGWQYQDFSLRAIIDPRDREAVQRATAMAIAP